MGVEPAVDEDSRSLLLLFPGAVWRVTDHNRGAIFRLDEPCRWVQGAASLMQLCEHSIRTSVSSTRGWGIKPYTSKFRGSPRSVVSHRNTLWAVDATGVLWRSDEHGWTPNATNMGPPGAYGLLANPEGKAFVAAAHGPAATLNRLQPNGTWQPYPISLSTPLGTVAPPRLATMAWGPHVILSREESALARFEIAEGGVKRLPVQKSAIPDDIRRRRVPAGRRGAGATSLAPTTMERRGRSEPAWSLATVSPD